MTAPVKRAAEEPFEEIGGRAVHRLDLVGGLANGDTKVTAGGAMGVFGGIDPKPAAGALALGALSAFVDLAAIHLLPKCAASPDHIRPAMSANS